MHKIQVKNQSEPILVANDSLGSDIKIKFESSTVPMDTQFKIENWSGYKSEIRSVTFMRDVPKTDANRANDHSADSYRRHRKEMLALPKSELARHMQYFGFVYQMLSQRNYRDDIELVREVYRLQLKFFTENANVILPDPAIFSDIFRAIKPETILEDSKEATGDRYVHMKGAGFGTYSQAYMWEMRYAKNNNQ